MNEAQRPRTHGVRVALGAGYTRVSASLERTWLCCLSLSTNSKRCRCSHSNSSSRTSAASSCTRHAAPAHQWRAPSHCVQRRGSTSYREVALLAYSLYSELPRPPRCPPTLTAGTPPTRPFLCDTSERTSSSSTCLSIASMSPCTDCWNAAHSSSELGATYLAPAPPTGPHEHRGADCSTCEVWL